IGFSCATLFRCPPSPTLFPYTTLFRSLAANDIGRVRIRTAEPLPVDAYADSRRTGSFILIDPSDGTTLTAGMVGESIRMKEPVRSEEHTSELQSRENLVCRLLLEKKKH